MSTEKAAVRSRRRWSWMMAIGAVVLLAVGSAVAWAVLTVLHPAEDPLEATNHTYVTVVQGEVGSSIGLNTVARWEPVPVGTNRAAGVVTGVSVTAGEEVDQGSVVYTLDLRPVVVAEGAVPAFRSIGIDAEGPDVAQLQTMLGALGFYGGPVDGEAGAGTIEAIENWHDSLGMESTGIVGEGDVIFVPSLPTRISLDTEVVRRAAMLSGGEEIVRGLSEAPVFTIAVTDAQAGMMPTDTRVEITSPEGGVWEALVEDREREPDTGTVVVHLRGEDGTVICADQCAQIPASEDVSLPSEIVTVASVSGLVVPSAALVTGADGQIAVIDEDGERIAVKVQTAAKGMAVVEGITEGTRVQVPGEGDG